MIPESAPRSCRGGAQYRLGESKKKIISKKLKKAIYKSKKVCYYIFRSRDANEIYGALAQLVARYIRIVEVTGSNPVCSTIKGLEL